MISRSLTGVGNPVSCTAQKRGTVLFWLPLLLIPPLLDVGGPPLRIAAQLGLLAVMVTATLVAVLTSRPGQGWQPYAALALLAAAVVAGSAWGGGWQVPWILLAITAPAVLRGWLLGAAILLVTGGSALTSWLHGDRGETFWISVGGVLLAGVTTTSFLRLLEMIDELRRTREELARVAVSDERERFSRDLHDLLGHTLSVMVVKAEAVRRLVSRDPIAAEQHAADIEQVGREALLEVRQAVEGMRAPSLADALEGARQALDSAGISQEVTPYDGQLPEATDQALAWVVREATTNVLRHSGADRCHISLTNGEGRLRLTVIDDGVGGPPAGDRRGGLDGLRRRLDSVGGSLEVAPGPDGFQLIALVPEGRR